MNSLGNVIYRMLRSDETIKYSEKDEEELNTNLKVAEESAKFNRFEENIGKFKTESGRDIYYYGEEFGNI